MRTSAYRVLAGLFAAGAVASFAAGIATGHHDGVLRREAFERHVADLCVEAARRAPHEEQK